MEAHTYLHFNGNCEEAMTHYKDILGGEFTTFMRFKDAPEEVFTPPDFAKDWVMHCTLEFGGTLIMGSDYLNENQPFQSGNNFAVSINSESVDEAHAIFQGLSEGAMVLMPFENAFWGGKFGMLVDTFGVSWMVSSEHK